MVDGHLLSYFNGDELAANKEEWRKIDDFNYSVSNFGNIKNLGTLTLKNYRGNFKTRKPKILKNRLSSNGYYISFKNKFIHRLVAKAFIPNPNNYPEVNHIDGNKLNNHVNNLEWCTSSMNQKHAYKAGLQIKNPKSSSKLTFKQIEEIRILYSTKKYKQKELGEKFGIKQQAISKIINFKRWK